LITKQQWLNINRGNNYFAVNGKATPTVKRNVPAMLVDNLAQSGENH